MPGRGHVRQAAPVQVHVRQVIINTAVSVSHLMPIQKIITIKDNSLLLDKEINNGRLAMIGASDIIAQELVTGNPIFS